jgi:hypothetical protein
MESPWLRTCPRIICHLLDALPHRAGIKWRSLLARADSPGVAKALAQIFAKHSPELAAMVHTTAAVTQVGVIQVACEGEVTAPLRQGTGFGTCPGAPVWCDMPWCACVV